MAGWMDKRSQRKRKSFIEERMTQFDFDYCGNMKIQAINREEWLSRFAMTRQGL